MKYEIDKQILDVTKQLILSTRQDVKELSHREPDFDRKSMFDSIIICLSQAFTNLDEHANKPKPIRKIGITTK